MGALHISAIVGHWLRVEKQPWIVWQGEFKYSEAVRHNVPLLVFTVIVFLVFVTGVLLLTPDVMDLASKEGGKR